MRPFKTKRSIQKHLVTLTKELARFPSHCDEILKLFEVAEFIKDYFAKDNVHIAEHVINGVPNLMITTEPTKHPHLLLSGHIDVVSSSSNFNAEVKGDRLYGSGVMDMKGGVACMMAAMKYFANQKNRPSLGLMITGDEELGGESTRLLLEEEGYSTDFCLVNEGRHSYEIVTREKGFLAYKLRLKGKTIHSAYPWKGVNVLEELMKLCLAVKKDYPKPKNGWTPTATVTALGGGKQVNTIPEEAVAILSFRLTGGKKWTREATLKRIKAKAKTLKLRSLEIEEMIHGPVFKMNPKNAYLQLLAKAVRQVRGRAAKFGENNGASDARFFMEQGIPTGILGPVGREHHTINEWVSIPSLVTHFEVIRKFIENEQQLNAAECEGLCQ